MARMSVVRKIGFPRNREADQIEWKDSCLPFPEQFYFFFQIFYLCLLDFASRAVAVVPCPLSVVRPSVKSISSETAKRTTAKLWVKVPYLQAIFCAFVKNVQIGRMKGCKYLGNDN